MNENELMELIAAAGPGPRSAGTRAWYSITAKAGAGSEVIEDADVNVYDVIGGWYEGVSAKQFNADLAALPASVKTIRVHVNSPGGDVFDAISIANQLSAHPATKLVTIEGLAASAATIITQGAGGKVTIADNAVVMIHNPYSLAMGTAEEMRKTADVLDRAGAAIVATYQRKSKKSAKELSTMMAETTWMDADEAIANGFADAKSEGVAAQASIDPRGIISVVPEKFAAMFAPVAEVEPVPAPVPEPEPVPQPSAASPDKVIAIVAEAGIPATIARDILEAHSTIEDARQIVSAARERQTNEAARVADIKALCLKFKMEDLSEGYIAGAMTLDQVKAHLGVIRARFDRDVVVDASLTPDGGVRRKQVINYTEVYERVNNPIVK